VTGGYLSIEAELSSVAGRMVRLGNEHAGLALLLRDRGIPVGFEMVARSASAGENMDLASLVPESARWAAVAARLHLALRKPDQRRTLTVAICTRDRPDWLARLLSSLAPLQVQHGFELLVIDNAPSDDRTMAECSRQTGVVYRREAVPGLNFGRNRALQEASGDIIAYLDDDVVVDGGWFEGLASAWSDNPDAGAITGLVLPLRLDTPAQVLFEQRGGFRRGFRRIRYGRTAFRDRLHPFGAGKFGAGANMSMRRELILKLGGFDEALDTGKPLPGGGDLDIFFRVLRSGAALIYEPRMAVFHDHRERIEVLARQYYTWGLGFGAFVAKTRSEGSDSRAKANSLLRWWFADQAVRLARSLIGRDVTPAHMVLGEIGGGFKGICGEYARSQRRSDALKEKFGDG
jgi:GT2 family glycosyltransferase